VLCKQPQVPLAFRPSRHSPAFAAAHLTPSLAKQAQSLTSVGRALLIQKETNMTDNTITIPPLPTDLDKSRLHTPAEVRAWEAARFSHFDAIRAAENAKAQAEYVASQPRYLTPDEYYAEGVERFNAQKLKDLERETAALAAEQEKAALLASRPATVEIAERNPVAFLTQLQHWHTQGYLVDFEAMLTILPTLYHVTLNAPAKSTKGTK
jgi:hypothetical protein